MVNSVFSMFIIILILICTWVLINQYILQKGFTMYIWSFVVGQLLEWSLLTPEINYGHRQFLFSTNSAEMTKITKKMW